MIEKEFWMQMEREKHIILLLYVLGKSKCLIHVVIGVCTTGTLHNGANSSGFFGVKLSSLTSKQIFYRQFAKGFELNIIYSPHQANLDELTLYIKQTQMS